MRQWHKVLRVKVLMLHNYYQQPGGEDQSFESEVEMLTRAGIEIVRYTRDNDETRQIGKLKLAVDTIWNQRSYRDVKRLLRLHRPQILHATNLFPLISPSVFHAARSEGVATVQSLRNYRNFCPNAMLFRENSECRLCQKRSVAWPGVAHRCYRNSHLASAVVAAQQTAHRMLATWSRGIDWYFAVSEFVREEHIKAGFPAERIQVKPNSPRADFGTSSGKGGFALYVGRLSKEKGLHTVLQAWQESTKMPLKIAGSGPLASVIAEMSAECSSIEFLGEKPWQEILTLMQDAACVLVPSIWPEPFGRVVVESFSCATPIIAARAGALPDLIDDGRTGFLFEPGSCEGLLQALGRFQCLNTSELSRLRANARAEFEQYYTEARNVQSLLQIYQRAQDYRKRCAG